MKFAPEDVAAMASRFWWAVAEPAEKGERPDRANVFDFDDGLRLIVSVDTNAAYAKDGKCIRLSVSGGHGGMPEPWWKIDRGNVGLVFARVAEIVKERYESISGVESVVLRPHHAETNSTGGYVFHFWIGEAKDAK